MGKIDYKAIYKKNRTDWKAMTEEPQRYEALLAGHYSDSNHFVYELLQNAEDEQASIVVIEYTDKGLIFFHNGKPFTEEDVVGISSMLMGKKQMDTIDKNSAQTIGHFGMGFKSVYKYTCMPQIFSDDEQFCIKNYLLPVETNYTWDYKAVLKALSYPMGAQKQYFPFKNEKHLTRIVIPFAKRTPDGKSEPISGKDVLIKLRELDGEILLFLTHIRELFWIDRTSGEKTKISLEENGDEYTCRIEGTNYADKENVSRYLKFKHVFSHKDMKYAEVSVAYSINPRSNTVNEVEESPIWVYFPTRDETDLPFLIHGSFETAVSREKLMSPSDFNDALFDELGTLIANSLKYLAKRNMITQAFIRRILIPAFEDEAQNDTIPGLKEKVTQAFLDNAYLLDINGKRKMPSELQVAVPFRITDFKNTKLFGQAFPESKEFVQFSNERESGFTEYYVWLTEDLGVEVFSLSDWAMSLSDEKPRKLKDYPNGMDELERFYDVISDFRTAVYGVGYSRGGEYASAVKEAIDTAWDYFRIAPIVLNAEESLVAAYKEGKPAVYLNASSKYKRIPPSAVVNAKISDGKYNSLLRDGFQIREFDNFQFVKEKVIKKYIEGDKINFKDSEHFEKEYIEDLNQIIELLNDVHSADEVKDLLSEAFIIKIKTDDVSSNTFARPSQVYSPISEEGIDLDVFFKEIDFIQFRVYDDLNAIDEEFFEEHGIDMEDLIRFGLFRTPVIDGRREQNGVGDNYWKALGDFCPEIHIEGLDENIEYISDFSDEEIAREKSAAILQLLLSISHKLVGTKQYRKVNPRMVEGTALILYTIRGNEWLYDRQGNLCRPDELSKYDLDDELYGPVIDDENAYSILGFTETEDDFRAETFKQVGNLDRDARRNLFEQLAREFGYDLSAVERVDGDDDYDSDSFDPNSWVSDEFPVHRVRNIDNLVSHVREQFFCADPVKYEKVWRQLRTSKPDKARRSYVTGMYTNESGVVICQMCRDRAKHPEAIEIANYGIEMPQLGLCLCKDCAASYKMIRDRNKSAFRDDIKRAVFELDISEGEDEYIISIDSEDDIYFTETHIAEIQEVLRLLEEYGIPNDRSSDEPLVDVFKKSDNAGSYAETKDNQKDIDSEIVIKDKRFANAADILLSLQHYSDKGILVSYDPSYESIEISFDYRHSDTVRNRLVNNGWRWHRMNQYWYKAFGIESAQFALELAGYRFDDDSTTSDDNKTNVVKEGDLVTYQDIPSGTKHEIQINPAKYPLHHLFMGKTVGDEVEFSAKRRKIVSIF